MDSEIGAARVRARVGFAAAQVRERINARPTRER